LLNSLLGLLFDFVNMCSRLSHDMIRLIPKLDRKLTVTLQNLFS